MRTTLLALSAAVVLFVSGFNATAGESASPLDGIEFGKNAGKWEVRGGVAAYDAGPFTPRHFSGGVINGEILAPSPDFLVPIGAPRPYIGADIAISDHPIHVFYAGLNWEAYLAKNFYVGFSAGGSVNTSEEEANDAGEVKRLGSNVLFHLQASVGFDISETTTAQLYLNHFSNAGLADSNNGLESVGIRFGIRF